MMVMNQMVKTSKYFVIVLHVKADVILFRKCACSITFGEKGNVGCKGDSVGTVYGYHTVTVNQSCMYNRN